LTGWKGDVCHEYGVIVMNSGSPYHVVLLYSTSHSVRAEKIAKAAGFKVKLIPTPRHIISDCGIVLRINVEDRDAIVTLFEEKKLEYEGIVALEKS